MVIDLKGTKIAQASEEVVREVAAHVSDPSVANSGLPPALPRASEEVPLTQEPAPLTSLVTAVGCAMFSRLT